MLIPKSVSLEETIVEHVKFWVLAVINKTLFDSIQTGRRFENWPAEDQRVYHVVIAVEEETLRRVERTVTKRKRNRARI